MPDPHAPSPDALDAMDALEDAVALGSWPAVRMAFTKARAAVRRLAEQGERGTEWDITLHSSIGTVEMRTPPGADRWEVYDLDGCKVTGVRVRVTRIEEAP